LYRFSTSGSPATRPRSTLRKNRVTAHYMDAIIVLRDQDHDYRDSVLPAPGDLFSFSALGRQVSTLDEHGSNGSGDFENGPISKKRLCYEELRKLTGAPTVQEDSCEGGIQTVLDREARDPWYFSDHSGSPWELQRFTDIDACGTNWQTLEYAVPQSEKLGLVVRSEFADTAVPDPTERSLPSFHLEAAPDLSGSLSNSTESIAGSSSRTVWNSVTGELVPVRLKRSPTTQERVASRSIRSLGGQCGKCKKGKRKVCLV
jgi:hypothetical protein